MSKSGGFREMVETARNACEFLLSNTESYKHFSALHAALAAARVEAVEELIEAAIEIAGDNTMRWEVFVNPEPHEEGFERGIRQRTVITRLDAALAALSGEGKGVA